MRQYIVRFMIRMRAIRGDDFVAQALTNDKITQEEYNEIMK